MVSNGKKLEVLLFYVTPKMDNLFMLRGDADPEYLQLKPQSTGGKITNPGSTPVKRSKASGVQTVTVSQSDLSRIRKGISDLLQEGVQPVMITPQQKPKSAQSMTITKKKNRTVNQPTYGFRKVYRRNFNRRTNRYVKYRRTYRFRRFL